MVSEQGAHPSTGSTAAPPRGLEIANAFCEEFLTAGFFEKYWEKQPLHHRAAERGRKANQLPEAISTDDIMTVMRTSGGSLKMFRSGQPYDIDNFCIGYLDGVSLIVNQADRCNRTLVEFCQELARRHFHHVFGVLYLTPPGSQAVGLHSDDQDVLLLQVWGTKRWKIRNNPVRLPYTEEMLGKDVPVAQELIKDPIMEFTIEPGDVLYIPRGFLHEAETGTDSSLHVTITVPTSDYCWGVQMVKHVLHQIQHKEVAEPLRHFSDGAYFLPRSRGPEDSTSKDGLRDADIEDLLSAWASEVNVDGVLNAFGSRMARMNEGQDRTLAQKSEVRLPPAVTEAARVRLMYGINCRCEEGDEVAVFSRAQDGQILELGIKKSASALVRSLTSKPQRVTTLPCKDAFERLCVLQLLLSQGVLQLLLDEAPPSSSE
eukprot:TRINITY_DN33925_c0_g1_i1.p1 TRINITY_DN33925_c0_g1~~TRINITY_DN33925_c0_g1_i1.p1  ORF type:complete len:430 (-),score=93.91 TRINITY_DN33925_c0_g1_i1:101-1390(-)